MTKWEYKLIQYPTKEEINRLGDEGWEAVGMAQMLNGGTVHPAGLHADYFVVLLKRPKT